MKTTIRFKTARLATTLIAAAVLLFALPGAARAADWKVASLASAPLAKGAGYEFPSGSQPVRHLQRQLRRLGQRPGPIDGLFGPLTEGAVRRFQHWAGVRVDGLVGPKTATRLTRSMAAMHRRAVKHQRLNNSRPQIHRSLLDDGRAVVDRGRGQPRASVPGASERSSGDTPPVVVGLLIALCVALALALLSTLTPRSRGNGARHWGTDLAEPAEPTPTPTRAATPHREPATQNGNQGRSQAPGRNGPVEIAPQHTNPSASGAPAGSQATGPAAERRRPQSGAAVIGYVSVGEQERLANGESYAAQVQAIETFCRRHGLRLVQIVRDVECVGSRAAPAPGLQHACQALAGGEARALVVQGLGRLTRSPARLALLVRWLADAHRALIAIDSELDTSTSAGRKTAKALMEVGDWDRERAQRRARNRVHEGGGGRPAVRDLPELHARIAAMREQGLSLHAIADTLNAEGVATLRGGSHWRASSVQAAVGYKRPTARNGTTGLTLPEPPPATADEEAKR